LVPNGSLLARFFAQGVQGGPVYAFSGHSDGTGIVPGFLQIIEIFEDIAGIVINHFIGRPVFKVFESMIYFKDISTGGFCQSSFLNAFFSSSLLIIPIFMPSLICFSLVSNCTLS